MAAVGSENNVPSLVKRDFINIETNPASNSEETIRIMQWNILAQALIEDNFPKCPPKALDVEFRKQHITEEILRYKPTVVCLEEVEHFQFLLEKLGNYGYSGIFKPKPVSPCLDYANNYGPDGCAVFYDSSALEMVKHDGIVLKAWGLETNQVAIICQFQSKTKMEKEFIVTVTHLKAGYQASNSCEDIRKEQAIYLSNYLEDNFGKFPMILCGDFNFPPSEQGYQVLLSCDLELSSAYTSLSPNGCEPKYTFWTVTNQELCKTIDYIWYSKKGFKVSSLLNVASEEEIGKSRLPSFKYPSDHISLVCDFILPNDSEVSENNAKRHTDENQENTVCNCL